MGHHWAWECHFFVTDQSKSRCETWHGMISTLNHGRGETDCFLVVTDYPVIYHLTPADYRDQYVKNNATSFHCLVNVSDDKYHSEDLTFITNECGSACGFFGHKPTITAWETNNENEIMIFISQSLYITFCFVWSSIFIPSSFSN